MLLTVSNASVTKALSVLLMVAITVQSAIACGGGEPEKPRSFKYEREPRTEYPRKDVRVGLIRPEGWHPLWLNDTYDWHAQATTWGGLERYFIAEVAELNAPGDRFVLPDTAEIYSTVESLPKLRAWTTLLSAARVVRFIADGRVFAYGLYVSDDDTPRCGPNNRHRRDSYWWDRKHGNNYCEELRPVKPRKDEEEPPPVGGSSQGALGCGLRARCADDISVGGHADVAALYRDF